jgi:hypothetical protein
VLMLLSRAMASRLRPWSHCMITRDFIVSGIAAGIFVFYLLKK